MLPGTCVKHGEFYGLMCSECLKPDDISEFLQTTNQAVNIVKILSSPLTHLIDTSTSYVELPALMYKLDELIYQQSQKELMYSEEEKEVYNTLQTIEQNNLNLTVLKPLPTYDIDTDIKALPYTKDIE